MSDLAQPEAVPVGIIQVLTHPLPSFRYTEPVRRFAVCYIQNSMNPVSCILTTAWGVRSSKSEAPTPET